MGTLNLFYNDAQNQLRTREVTGVNAFSGETPVTPIAGSPRNLVALARIPETAILELFYADESGTLQSLESFAGSAWSQTPQIGGPVNGNITAAVAPGTNFLHVFYRNAADQVIAQYRNGNGPWSGEVPLGVPAASDISAIPIPGSMILHLFYRAAAGGVQALWRDANGTWHTTDMGGSPVGGVAACRVPGSNAINIFYRNAQGTIITRQRTAAGAWTPEQPLQGTATSDVTAVVLPAPASDYLQLFYRGTAGGAMTMWRSPSTGEFNAEGPLGGAVIAGGTITAAAIPGSGALGLFYRGPGSTLKANFRGEGGQWTGEHDEGGALASDVSAAPTPQPFVTPSPDGLKSNSNFFVFANGAPLVGLSATMEIDQEITSTLGFAFQFNCWSPPGAACEWQQYNLRIIDNAFLGWHVENWNHDMSVNIVEAYDNTWVALPQANALPAGSRLVTAINDDGSNARFITFIYVEPDGTVHRADVDLLNCRSNNKGVTAPVTAAGLAPIVAAQLSLVGPTTATAGPLKAGATQLNSGLGSITYAAATPMTVVSTLPPEKIGFNLPVPGHSEATGESSNSVYGPMPPGPDYAFTQWFNT